MRVLRSISVVGVAVGAVVLTQAAPSQAASPAKKPTCFGKPATIIGTAGPDHLEGGPNDVIVGLGGDDWIVGGTACGGAGNDRVTAVTDFSGRLDGGDGNDYLESRFGPSDTLLGGAGDDVLYDTDDFDWPDSFDPGTDVMRGGPGSDRIYSSSGQNVVYGDEGDDQIADSTHVRTVIYGGAGNDTIDATLDNTGDNPYEPDVVAGDRGKDTATVNRVDTISTTERIVYVD